MTNVITDVKNILTSFSNERIDVVTMDKYTTPEYITILNNAGEINASGSSIRSMRYGSMTGEYVKNMGGLKTHFLSDMTIFPDVVYIYDKWIKDMNANMLASAYYSNGDMQEIMKAYVILRIIKNNGYVGIVRSSNYEDDLNNNIDVFASRIKTHLDVLKDSATSGIIGYIKNKNISLYQPSMEEIFKDQDIRIIYGYAINNNGFISGELIDSIKNPGYTDKLIKAYERERDLVNAKHMLTNRIKIADVYKDIIDVLYRRDDEYLLDLSIRSKLESDIDDLSYYDLLKVDATVLKIMTGVFRKTNFGSFYKYRTELMTANSELTKEDVTILAVAKLITQLLLKGVRNESI
jgi:hypothetical protein